MFDGNTEIFKYDIKNIFLKYLVKIVRSATRKVMIIILLITHNNTVKDFEWFYKSEGNEKEIRFLEDLVPAWRNKYIIIVFELLFTPPDTFLKCLFIIVLVMAILKNIPNKNLLSVWEYKFELV